jgi:hypothetical protein
MGCLDCIHPERLNFRLHSKLSTIDPLFLRRENKETLTAFIDLFQLIHRRKGEKFITGLTTNS